MVEKVVVTVAELQKLLIAMKEKTSNVCFRYRSLGEMWAPQFARVVLVSRETVVLNDEANNTLIKISNIKNIVQFEIDHAFQQYKPHFHYQVIL